MELASAESGSRKPIVDLAGQDSLQNPLPKKNVRSADPRRAPAP